MDEDPLYDPDMVIKALLVDGTEVQIGMQWGENELTADHLEALNRAFFVYSRPVQAIKIPEHVLTMDHDVDFSIFMELQRVHLPSTLESMTWGAFHGCDHLRSINIPPGITTIPNSCFENCTRLQRITLNDGLVFIAHMAFLGSGLEHIDIPPTVKKIGKEAFSGCDKLKSVRFAEAGACQLEEIEFDAFSGTALRRVRIPPSVKHIGPYAFYTGNPFSPLEVVYFEGRGRNQRSLADLFTNSDYEDSLVLNSLDRRSLTSRFGVNSVDDLTPDMRKQLLHVRFYPTVRLVLCDNQSAFVDDDTRRLQFPNVEYSPDASRNNYGMLIPGGFESLTRIFLRLRLLKPGERLGATALRDEGYRDMVAFFAQGGVARVPEDISELVLAQQQPSTLWFDI